MSLSKLIALFSFVAVASAVALPCEYFVNGVYTTIDYTDTGDRDVKSASPEDLDSHRGLACP
jgi:hypothetical protein